MNSNEETVIIKKNIITIFVPMMLFFPGILLVAVILFGVFTNDTSFGLIFMGFIATLFLITPGALVINQFIRFGNKKCVINNDGITLCNLKVKTFLWQEIVDIEYHALPNLEFIKLITKSGQKIEMNLGDVKLNVSGSEMYDLLLERWSAGN